MKINLANKVTLLRIALIPIIMYFTLSGLEFIALWLFVFAALSDMADGLIARSQDKVSAFGKFADPIADKLLISAILVTFVQMRELGAVPVVVILGREFIVTGFRLTAMAKDQVIAASSLGKAKMVAQIALIIAVFVVRTWNWKFALLLKPWLLYLTLALTITSGIHYFYKNRKILRGTV